MANRKPKGDVEWTLPGKKRVFAYSTKATNDLIVLLSENDSTVQEAYDAVNYDDEAKAILQHFIDNGYGDIVLSLLVTSDGRPVAEKVKSVKKTPTVQQETEWEPVFDDDAQAVIDSLVVLGEKGLTVQAAYDSLTDADAKAILQYFLNDGFAKMILSALTTIPGNDGLTPVERTSLALKAEVSYRPTAADFEFIRIHREKQQQNTEAL